jgi:2-dehydro-3-deoxygluconokinase
MMKKIVTFGEIMARLTPKGVLRFRQTLPGDLQLTFAGAEANVAAAVSLLGGKAEFVTALPQNSIADACIANLRAIGVDTNRIIRTDNGRLGLYFVETGANQRPSNVIYDRSDSAVSLAEADKYCWDEIFADADWFHITGITPALSRTACEAAIEAVKKAKENNVTVSCDLNFRKKLWNWDADLSAKALARKTMPMILNLVDVVIANEQDASDVLDIQAGTTDVSSGHLDIEKYPVVAAKINERFANVSTVAITLRESISASHNNWGAMLYDCASKKAYFAPLADGKYQPYQITNIVDRVGGGDSFAGALIFALNTPEFNEPYSAVAFAVAASCLAHSIKGDFNYSTRNEIENLMKGMASGRVVR